jgi:hypothetical protein
LHHNRSPTKAKEETPLKGGTGTGNRYQKAALVGRRSGKARGKATAIEDALERDWERGEDSRGNEGARNQPN